MIDPGGPLGAMLSIAAAVALLVPAVLALLWRWDAMSLPLALLGSAVLTSLAAFGAVIADTTTRPWLIALVPVTYAVAVVRVVVSRSPVGTPRRGDWVALGGAAAAAVPALAFLYRGPVQWDARSIWYFHASWFAEPATVYTEFASYSPVYKFAHADYPPLGPSFTAYAWLFGEPRNDWTAQMAIGVLMLAAIAVLVILIARSLDSANSRAVAAVVATVVVIGIVRGNSLDGYMDGLTAVLLSVLAVMAFRERDVAVPLIAGMAVGLAKNEGLALLVVGIVPFFLFVRRTMVAWLIPGVVIGGLWAMWLRTIGADLHQWRLGNALPWSAGFLDRLGEILAALTSYASFLVPLLLWAGAVSLGFGVRWSREVRMQVLSLGILAAWVFFVVVGMYLASPHDDLTWHLSTSADRLVLHPSLLLASGGLLGLGGAWSAVRSRRSLGGDHESGVAEDEAVAD